MGSVDFEFNKKGSDLNLNSQRVSQCRNELTHHRSHSGPERAGSKSGSSDHSGENLSGVNIADGQGVDQRDPSGEVEDQEGPLVREMVERNEVGQG